MAFLEIENALKTLLDSTGTVAIFNIPDINKQIQEMPELRATPAIGFAINAGNVLDQMSNNLTVQLEIPIYVFASNLQSEKARRHVIYPIVEALIARLNPNETLGGLCNGLKIARFEHVPFSDQQVGMIAYRIDMRTDAHITITDDDISPLLTAIHNDYKLDKDNNIIMQDDITL